MTDEVFGNSVNDNDNDDRDENIVLTKDQIAKLKYFSLQKIKIDNLNVAYKDDIKLFSESNGFKVKEVNDMVRIIIKETEAASKGKEGGNQGTIIDRQRALSIVVEVLSTLEENKKDLPNSLEEQYNS